MRLISIAEDDTQLITNPLTTRIFFSTPGSPRISFYSYIYCSKICCQVATLSSKLTVSYYGTLDSLDGHSAFDGAFGIDPITLSTQPPESVSANCPKRVRQYVDKPMLDKFIGHML